MPDQLVEATHWGRFCSEFSAQHRGWRASLWVAGPAGAAEQGVRCLVREAEFRSLAPDSRREEAGLSVVLGRGTAHFAHYIPHPARLFTRRGEAGSHRGIRIETREGESYVLAFRSDVLPEQLDGYADAGP